MDRSKKKNLKKAGWKVGSTSEFLRLTAEEQALIELKLALAEYLKQCRHSRKLTQVQLAQVLHSSQSRVAKMEAGDPTVSIDLLLRSLLVLGTSPKQLARVIGSLALPSA
jgi:DNA-binding XRE family transcriptional regulator